MPQISIHLNDVVRVKLNDDGLSIYRSLGRVPLEPRLQPDGTFSAHLWEIMAIFGPHTRLGRGSPFETGIIFETSKPPTPLADEGFRFVESLMIQAVKVTHTQTDLEVLFCPGQSKQTMIEEFRRRYNARHDT